MQRSDSSTPLLGGVISYRELTTTSSPQSAAMNADGGSSTGTYHVISSVRQERRIRKNLKLQYGYFEYFVYSQCLPAWLLLILRLAMGCVCVCVFLYMSIMSPFVNFAPANSTDSSEGTRNDTTANPPMLFKRHFYLCYLTIWSYLVIIVYFITTLVNIIAMWRCSREQSVDFSISAGGFKSTENLLDARDPGDAASATSSRSEGAVRQFGFRLQWLLCGIASNAALLVTAAYFTVLYPMIKRANQGPINPVDLLVHGFNSIFMLIEVLCSGVPIRLVHAVYTALYGLIYALFSLLYWIPDHSNVIYPVLLDWNHAGLTVGMLCLMLFVGLPIIQLVWWLIYLARCFIATALVSRATSWKPGLTV